MTSLDTPTTVSSAPAGQQPPADAPDQIGAWLDRLVRLTRLPPSEAAELRDELDAHLRERVRDLMLGGHDEPDAVHKSISELGDLAQLAQRYREASRTPRRRLFMNIAMIAVAGSALGLSTLALQQDQPETPATALEQGEYQLVPKAVVTPEGTGISLEIVPRLAGDARSVPVLADVPIVGRLFDAGAAAPVTLGQSADDHQLRDVLLMLAEPYDARVYTYWNDLEMMDLAVDTQVGFLPFEGQSVEKALAMLSDAYGLAGDDSLDHRVENGLMEIATRRFFDQREVTLVSYDASDLLMADSPLEQSDSSETLMALVMSLVEPDVWEANGGLASVNAAGNRLFINAPTRIHERVVWLLRELAAERSSALPKAEGDALVVVVYPLSNTNTEHVAGTLADTLAPFHGSVQPDPRNNSVIVSGTRAVQSAAEVIVRALDRDATADNGVAEIPSGPVSIEGAVGRPGKYELPADSGFTLARLLSSAQGPANGATRISVYRGHEDALVHLLDVAALETMPEASIPILAGDRIVVARD